MNQKNTCTKPARSIIIPYKIHEGVAYINVMRPSNSFYGGFQYQLAKGRIDEGETPKQAAIRECREELGLILEEANYLYMFNNRDYVFYCEVETFDMNIKFEFESIHTAWLSLKEFLSIGRTYQHAIVKKLYSDLKLDDLDSNHFQWKI